MTPDTPTAAASAGRGRRIVATFAVTQTVGYGTLYYAFAVVLRSRRACETRRPSLRWTW
ncbi:hypothetical protein ACFFX1_52700 [Dactylosporangium sucinum]|nr:hypothetical protein [Dactylosporangium sucinum]